MLLQVFDAVVPFIEYGIGFALETLRLKESVKIEKASTQPRGFQVAPGATGGADETAEQDIDEHPPTVAGPETETADRAPAEGEQVAEARVSTSNPLASDTSERASAPEPDDQSHEFNNLDGPTEVESTDIVRLSLLEKEMKKVEFGVYGSSSVEEYMPLVIQFGFLSMFGASFPVAALLALISNIIQLRLTVFKVGEFSIQ